MIEPGMFYPVSVARPNEQHWDDEEGGEHVAEITADAPKPPPLQGSHRWWYCNGNGCAIMAIDRIEPRRPGERKIIRPLTLWRDRDGTLLWRAKQHPAPRPMFALDRMAARKSAPLLIVEGEKKIEPARSLFPDYEATCSAGGSNAAKQTDWSPCAGRDVVIWPDNDQAGARYATSVSDLAMAAGATSVCIVQVPPQWSEGWDLADPLPDGVTVDQLREMLTRASPIIGNDGNCIHYGPAGEASTIASPRKNEGAGTAGNDARDPLGDEPTPWPALASHALHGLAGEIVAAAIENSEADPAAVLATLLTHAGTMVGRGPRVRVGDGFHRANLFSVIVGQSARGRKGTSEKPIRRIGERAAELNRDLFAWQHGPLSTGEGLAYAIRDGDGQEDGDPGVTDKRLLITEGEFAAPLRAMQRQGNTLSTALRSAWDGTTISPMTKSNRVAATDPHVGIVGHITKVELGDLLSKVDIFNGFANRFLWWCARRSKSLPLAAGMAATDVERLAGIYAKRLADARQLGEIGFTGQAREMYVALYDDIAEDRNGLHAIVTARAEVQVVRLALSYAVIDAERTISVDHLTAAIAAWEYCDASALYLFGGVDPNPMEGRIVDALTGGPLTTAELYSALGGHTRGEVLKSALESLETRSRIQRATTATGGRPRVTWQLQPRSGHANEAKKAN